MPCDPQAIAEACNTLTELKPFFAIVGLQLRSIVEQTEEAASGLLTQLRTLDDALADATAFIGTTRQRMGGLVEHGDTAYAALLAALHAYLATRLEETRSEREHLAAIADQMKELDGLTHVLEQVGNANNMLALNASIEAARGRDRARLRGRRAGAPDPGAALSRRGRGCERQDERDEGIHRGEPARSPHGSPRTGRAGEHRAPSGRGRRAVGSLRCRGRAQADLGAIDDRNHAITLQIMQAVGRVQFQDVVRQQIEGIGVAMGLLHRILDDQRDALTGMETARAVTPAMLMERVRSGYVTQIQHENDLRARGQTSDATALPDIELF
ncbi:hypothetical protein GCM10007886_37930 [Methylobacterium gregans]|nr:hypothetical protein GCM10007886_37930 [Methylobacterium gregans]